MIRRSIFVLALFLATAPGSAPRLAAQTTGSRDIPNLERSFEGCGFCVLDPGHSVRPLHRAEVDSVVRGHSDWNLRALSRTDSLYQHGFFGRPGTDDSRKRARVHWQLRVRNGFDYVARLAASANGAFASNEDDLLLPIGRDYTGVTVYPLRFIEQGLIGPSWFYLQYKIPATVSEKTWVGGDELRVRVEEDRDDDRGGANAEDLAERNTTRGGQDTGGRDAGFGDRLESRQDNFDGSGDSTEDRGGPQDGPMEGAGRVMLVAWPSRLHADVVMGFGSRVCGRIDHREIVDRGDTLDLIMFTGIEGMSVRRMGDHRLRALAFWRSVTRGDRDPLHPRIGACAYFPHIHMKLPSVLPDIGMDDLRDFDVPQPILPRAWFAGHRPASPEWFGGRAVPIPMPWDPSGERPKILAERFPDL